MYIQVVPSHYYDYISYQLTNQLYYNNAMLQSSMQFLWNVSLVQKWNIYLMCIKDSNQIDLTT